MKTKASDSQYICPEDSANGCTGNVFGYVYPSDLTQSIYMCEFVFNYPVRPSSLHLSLPTHSVCVCLFHECVPISSVCAQCAYFLSGLL